MNADVYWPISEARNHLAIAVPGEWFCDENVTTPNSDGSGVHYLIWGGEGDDYPWYVGQTMELDDAKAIVEIHNLLPKLLEHVDTLTAEITRLKALAEAGQGALFEEEES